jgi:acyl-CoA synthetase (AMP-forming)/AMP-acid ligase II
VTSTVVDAGDELPLTVPVLLRRRALSSPEHVLLATDGERLTYRKADERSAELARALLAAGVSAGTRVGLLFPNTPQFVTAWLAVARIGAVSAPLSTFSTGAELLALLRGADAAILLSAQGFRSHDYVATMAAAVDALDLSAPPPLLAEAAPSLRRIAFDAPAPDPQIHPAWTMEGLLAGAGLIGPDVLAAAEAAVTPADPMVIVHTSGSTSEPKGVVHCHGPLLRHLDNLNQLRHYDDREILFSNSPFFWIGGFAYSLLGTLVAGATLVCANAPTSSGLLDVLERERPTMVNGFAASVTHVGEDPTFSARDLTSIRRGNLYSIMPAAVRPVDPDLHHAMLGMTETGSVCLASADESEQPERRRGSFGRPVPGFEAAVCRPEDDVPCAPGEEGELRFRGPFLMDGYLGCERHETFDAENWFHTGDLVTVDAEGYFYFRGRRGDMIKTAGANVSPREVEMAIGELSGLVAHVFGVDHERRGQVVAAVVRAPEGSVDLEDLRGRLRTVLSAYKVPTLMIVVPDDEVPTMSSGKLDLRALRALFSAA